MTPKNDNLHKTTLRIPIPVWNAFKIAAIQRGKKCNDFIVEILRESFGEVADLTKIKATPNA